MNKYSRRVFVKTGLVSAAGLAGAASLSSYTSCEKEMENEIQVFHGSDWEPADGPAGLLFSQVGYELGWPVRIIVRLPQKQMLPQNSRRRLDST